MHFIIKELEFPDPLRCYGLSANKNKLSPLIPLSIWKEPGIM